jgi:exopolyphosphatase/guanosine-5'-triphosphate,3'-diphosphate pyrophosphatase
MPRAPIAVVDIGTNSTRLLVARVNDGQVEELERRSTVTRLGQGVDSSGRLADEAIARVLDALDQYRALIDEAGAETVIALATSAVRDSENGDEFRATLRERFGIEARTISGDEEARLTFLGATSARTDRDQPTLVIDIGGGSTELVIGRPGEEPDFHESTQAGSVRQTERHLHDDPPTAQQLGALRDEVRGIFEEAVPDDVRAGVTHGIAVAGTATQVASIARALAREAAGGDEPGASGAAGPAGPDERDAGGRGVHGYVLELDRVRSILERLTSVPLEERRQTPGLDPDRAPTIVAGAAILVVAMEAFGLDRVEASETDILHGAALVAATTENG